MALERSIKVFDKPPTWIVIGADEDEEEARQRWLKKHKYSKPLSDEQKRREFETIRGGKVIQRKYYHK